MTEQTLYEPGLMPNVINKSEIAATLHEAQVEISLWREKVKYQKHILG